MTELSHSGARWLRCDLHVHTPFDDEKGYKEDIRSGKPEVLYEIAERFVEACNNAADVQGLDIVAVTE